MYLEVFEGESGLWSVRLVGANGETMMNSETYDSKQNAQRAALTIQNAWDDADDIIEIRLWESE